jgi:hypothetical protein
MSALRKVPNYIVLFLMFLLAFTCSTFARIFPWLRHTPQSSMKVFALSGQEWADLRAGSEYQDTKAAVGDDKKTDEKQAEDKKSDESKKDSAKPSGNTDQSKDNDKSTGQKEPAKAPDTQSPGGGDGDLGGIGG